jgi:hypothetical protein
MRLGNEKRVENRSRALRVAHTETGAERSQKTEADVNISCHPLLLPRATSILAAFLFLAHGVFPYVDEDQLLEFSQHNSITCPGCSAR